MLRGIPEPDWKVFRSLQPIALERFSQRTLDEIVSAAAGDEKTSHERYLDVYALIKERDKDLAYMFDNPRRSTALEQLLIIQSRKLLTDEELSRFSQETRDVLELLSR